MRKKTTFNPELLKEELNRFRMLENYKFYSGKQEGPEFDKDKDKLILGTMEEAEEEPDAAADDIANELGVDPPSETPDDMGGDMPPEGDDMGGDMPPEGDDMGGDMPPPEGDDMGGDIPPPIEEPSSDDIEVDVTELVKGSEEAKMAADKASQNSEMLMQKLSDLESRIASMDSVSNKIAELEKEIIKRNPTPLEKLEVQVKNSFPYSQKLEDYWADKEGAYDISDKEPNEYTLTQDDVDNSYSEGDVKQSFTVKDEDFTEEDI